MSEGRGERLVDRGEAVGSGGWLERPDIVHLEQRAGSHLLQRQAALSLQLLRVGT